MAAAKGMPQRLSWQVPISYTVLSTPAMGIMTFVCSLELVYINRRVGALINPYRLSALTLFEILKVQARIESQVYVICADTVSKPCTQSQSH